MGKAPVAQCEPVVCLDVSLLATKRGYWKSLYSGFCYGMQRNAGQVSLGCHSTGEPGGLGLRGLLF